MALVAATIANGGEMPTPQIVSEIRDSDAGLVEKLSPGPVHRAISAEVARAISEMMLASVQRGTAEGLRVPGLSVGAKTGTAQTVGGTQDDTHAWVVAFASPEGADPDIALAVIVEAVPGAGQQTGGAVAVPIAAQVLAEAFRR